MILYDYECTCGEIREELVNNLKDPVVCEKCGELMLRIIGESCAKVFTTIVCMSPGAKKYKAGYVHSHSDRPSTKVQGCGFGKGQHAKD